MSWERWLMVNGDTAILNKDNLKWGQQSPPFDYENAAELNTTLNGTQ